MSTYTPWRVELVKTASNLDIAALDCVGALSSLELPADRVRYIKSRLADDLRSFADALAQRNDAPTIMSLAHIIVSIAHELTPIQGKITPDSLVDVLDPVSLSAPLLTKTWNVLATLYLVINKSEVRDACATILQCQLLDGTTVPPKNAFLEAVRTALDKLPACRDESFVARSSSQPIFLPGAETKGIVWPELLIASTRPRVAVESVFERQRASGLPTKNDSLHLYAFRFGMVGRWVGFVSSTNDLVVLFPPSCVIETKTIVQDDLTASLTSAGVQRPFSAIATYFLVSTDMKPISDLQLRLEEQFQVESKDFGKKVLTQESLRFFSPRGQAVARVQDALRSHRSSDFCPDALMGYIENLSLVPKELRDNIIDCIRRAAYDQQLSAPEAEALEQAFSRGVEDRYISQAAATEHLAMSRPTLYGYAADDQGIQSSTNDNFRQGWLVGVVRAATAESAFEGFSQQPWPPSSRNAGRYVPHATELRSWLRQLKQRRSAKIPDVDSDDLMYIQAYTDYVPLSNGFLAYEFINAWGHHPTRSENMNCVAKVYRGLIEALNNLPSNYDYLGPLYRFVKVPNDPGHPLRMAAANFRERYAQDQLITFHAFTSFGKDFDRLNRKFGDKREDLIIFKWPSGHGKCIQSLSVIPDEFEVLVPPPAVFRVIEKPIEVRGIIQVSIAFVPDASEQFSYFKRIGSSTMQESLAVFYEAALRWAPTENESALDPSEKRVDFGRRPMQSTDRALVAAHSMFFDVDELLNMDHPRAVLRGGQYSGKTSWMHWMARTQDDGKHVVLYIDMARLKSRRTPVPDSISVDCIVAFLLDSADLDHGGLQQSLDLNGLEQFLFDPKRPPVMWLVDGWSEVTKTSDDTTPASVLRQELLVMFGSPGSTKPSSKWCRPTDAVVVATRDVPFTSVPLSTTDNGGVVELCFPPWSTEHAVQEVKRILANESMSPALVDDKHVARLLSVFNDDVPPIACVAVALLLMNREKLKRGSATSFPSTLTDLMAELLNHAIASVARESTESLRFPFRAQDQEEIALRHQRMFKLLQLVHHGLAAEAVLPPLPLSMPLESATMPLVSRRSRRAPRSILSPRLPDEARRHRVSIWANSLTPEEIAEHLVGCCIAPFFVDVPSSFSAEDLTTLTAAMRGWQAHCEKTPELLDWGRHGHLITWLNGRMSGGSCLLQSFVGAALTAGGGVPPKVRVLIEDSEWRLPGLRAASDYAVAVAARIVLAVEDQMRDCPNHSDAVVVMWYTRHSSSRHSVAPSSKQDPPVDLCFLAPALCVQVCDRDDAVAFVREAVETLSGQISFAFCENLGECPAKHVSRLIFTDLPHIFQARRLCLTTAGLCFKRNPTDSNLAGSNSRVMDDVVVHSQATTTFRSSFLKRSATFSLSRDLFGHTSAICTGAYAHDVRNIDEVEKETEQLAALGTMKRVANFHVIDLAVAWTAFPASGLSSRVFSPNHVVSLPQGLVWFNSTESCQVYIEQQNASWKSQETIVTIRASNVVVLNVMAFLGSNAGAPGRFLARSATHMRVTNVMSVSKFLVVNGVCFPEQRD